MGLLLPAEVDLSAWMCAFSLSVTSSDRLLNLAASELALTDLKTALADFLYQTLDELVIIPTAKLLEGGDRTGGWSSRG